MKDTNSPLRVKINPYPYTRTAEKKKDQDKPLDCYLEKMRETLNRNIENNLFPHWRSHKSLKGWSSMNYPGVMTNPFLKQRPQPLKYDNISFSNLQRPKSAPSIKVQQPISQRLEAIRSQQKLSSFQNPMNLSGVGNSLADTSMNRPTTAASLMSNLSPTIMNISTNQASGALLRSTPSINKISTAALTTTKYEDKANIVEKMNERSLKFATIIPQHAYLGPKQEGFERRKVKQLDDIVFEDDFEEPEEALHFKRLPRSILTEDSLKIALTPTTEKLSLENHVWIRDNFLDKVGRLAPNLRDISLRGLEISGKSFIEIIKYCNLLKKIDVSQCKLLSEESISLIPQRCPNLIWFKAASCPSSVTDDSLSKFNELENLQLLDISYCNKVTDVALISLSENKNSCIIELYLNSLDKITNEGINYILFSCQNTLEVLELTLLEQPEVNDKACVSLANCSYLKALDLTGCKNIGDEGIQIIHQGPKENENPTIGLQSLKTLKLNGLERMSDLSLMKLCGTSNKIESLELARCVNLSEYGIGMVLKSLQHLRFIDVNNIPALSPQFVADIRNSKQQVQVRRYVNQSADPKDNGLLVPLKFKSKKKKKKKKKKSSKKKK